MQPLLENQKIIPCCTPSCSIILSFRCAIRESLAGGGGRESKKEAALVFVEGIIETYSVNTPGSDSIVVHVECDIMNKIF